MRPIAPHMVDLWRLVVAKGVPVGLVALLQDPQAQVLARRGRDSVAGMVDRLAVRCYLKASSAGRLDASREFWWDSGCMVPLGCKRPPSVQHPNTAADRERPELELARMVPCGICSTFVLRSKAVQIAGSGAHVYGCVPCRDHAALKRAIAGAAGEAS